MRNQTPLTRVLFVTVVLSLFILNPIAWADWQKTFGGEDGERAYSIRQTTDGGYVITGYTTSFGAGSLDVYLVKMDDSGNLEWQSTYGGTASDTGHSVQQTTDGGYIIAGESNSFEVGPVPSDVYLVKTDDSGNLEWENTYGGRNTYDEGYAVQQTTDGGYIIAGSSNSYSNGNWDVYLVKTDDSGNLEWQSIFGGAWSDHGTSVQQTTDGGYIIAGHTNSFGAGSTDVYLVKTDDSGNLEWENTYGGTANDSGNAVRQTTDGGYVIVGDTYSFGAGGTKVYLIKTDNSGNLEWQNTFGENDRDTGNAVQQTMDGGFIIAGQTSTYIDYYWYNDDVYLVKANDLGEQQWTRKFSKIQRLIFGSRDRAFSVQQTADGDYIIAGDTAPYFDPYQDAYVIKTTGECPSTVVSSESAVLENLREFRDEVLARSEAGRSIIDDYYDHSSEIVRILRRHPALMIRSGALLRDVMPGIHHLLDNKKGRNIVMTRLSASRIQKLFADISSEGGDELSVTLAGLNDRLDAGIGMRISEVRQILLEN